MIARCLAGLGAVALAQGHGVEAARLLAAAQRLFDELPRFLAPADSGQFAALVEAARAALDPQPLRQAWDDGTGMELEEAVRLALLIK